MATNRPIAAQADGSVVLRGGRYWRLLGIVNMASKKGVDCVDVEDALAQVGFDAPIVSAPQDWKDERPDDWPREDLHATNANECIVRASGALTPGEPLSIPRDWKITDGVTLSVVQAWDYGAAPELEQTGAKSPEKKEDETRSRVLIAMVLGLTGFGLFSLYKGNKKGEKDENRYASLAARADRDELAHRVQHYLQHGHTEAVAAELAEREVAALESRRLEEALALAED